ITLLDPGEQLIPHGEVLRVYRGTFGIRQWAALHRYPGAAGEYAGRIGSVLDRNFTLLGPQVRNHGCRKRSVCMSSEVQEDFGQSDIVVAQQEPGEAVRWLCRKGAFLAGHGLLIESPGFRKVAARLLQAS